MKKKIQSIIPSVFRALTGKSDEQMSSEWQWHHFRTRSRLRAYWRVLTA